MRVPISKVTFVDSLYPRQRLDEQHIVRLTHALQAGHTLPAIIVEKDTHRLVDGAHRWHAHSRAQLDDIEVEEREYEDDAEFFRDAVLLNSAAKLALTGQDQVKVAARAEELGIPENDTAVLLRIPVSHLRSIKPRYATVEEAEGDVSRLRRVPLKVSTRHFSGRRMTAEQAQANELAPGQSYLLSVRQLLSALESGLMPSPDEHAALWDELRRLHEVLSKALPSAVRG